jgi:retron-type reverse transcriptase
MNADRHQGARHLLKVDIKGCYQAIRQYHVELAILWQCGMAVSPELTEALDSIPLCFCRGKDGDILPTGSPTSPILCNIALTPVDHKVQAIADEAGYTYTRYLDDLILSTEAEKRQWGLLDRVGEVLEFHGFRVNKKKSKWHTRNSDQLIVTGVSLAKRKVERSLKRNLRARLHNIAREGREIDKQTQGYLAYVYSIDPETHQWLLDGYEKSKMR